MNTFNCVSLTFCWQKTKTSPRLLSKTASLVGYLHTPKCTFNIITLLVYWINLARKLKKICVNIYSFHNYFKGKQNWRTWVNLSRSLLPEKFSCSWLLKQKIQFSSRYMGWAPKAARSLHVSNKYCLKFSIITITLLWEYNKKLKNQANSLTCEWTKNTVC